MVSNGDGAHGVNGSVGAASAGAHPRPSTFLFTSESVGEGHPSVTTHSDHSSHMLTPVQGQDLVSFELPLYHQSKSDLTEPQRPSFRCDPRCLSRRRPTVESRLRNCSQDGHDNGVWGDYHKSTS